MRALYKKLKVTEFSIEFWKKNSRKEGPLEKKSQDKKAPEKRSVWTHVFPTTWCMRDIGVTRREFLREIVYRNIAIVAIQHNKMYFVDAFGDFSHTVG